MQVPEHQGHASVTGMPSSENRGVRTFSSWNRTVSFGTEGRDLRSGREAPKLDSQGRPDLQEGVEPAEQHEEGRTSSSGFTVGAAPVNANGDSDSDDDGGMAMEQSVSWAVEARPSQGAGSDLDFEA